MSQIHPYMHYGGIYLLLDGMSELRSCAATNRQNCISEYNDRGSETLSMLFLESCRPVVRHDDMRSEVEHLYAKSHHKFVSVL